MDPRCAATERAFAGHLKPAHRVREHTELWNLAFEFEVVVGHVELNQRAHVLQSIIWAEAFANLPTQFWAQCRTG